METSKLRNSCLCGNTIPYQDCCGRYSELVESANPEEMRYNTFRYELHELSVSMFHLRVIYQAYWESLVKEYPDIETAMPFADYSRAVIENFFWDYFLQYSDARPILRTAREIGSKHLRHSHDLIEWSFSPLWIYKILSCNKKTAQLENMGNGKIHTVTHSANMGAAGRFVLTRILPFREHEFCGHTVLLLPENSELRILNSACRILGIKPTVNLRPDVHCTEWRKHGTVFLDLWYREVENLASQNSPLTEKKEKLEVIQNRSLLNMDEWLHTSLESLNSQTPIEASLHDWGRQKLKRILNGTGMNDVDTKKIKIHLGLGE